MAQGQDAQSTRSATETQNNSPTLHREARHRRCRDVAATTAAVLLLLCCCFCCSTIRDAYKESESPEKNVPLRCSISFIWRSDLTRGAGTKNSNFTLPQRLEEGETSRDTGGNIAHRLERRVPAKKSHRKV